MLDVRSFAGLSLLPQIYVDSQWKKNERCIEQWKDGDYSFRSLPTIRNEKPDIRCCSKHNVVCSEYLDIRIYLYTIEFPGWVDNCISSTKMLYKIKLGLIILLLKSKKMFLSYLLFYSILCLFCYRFEKLFMKWIKLIIKYW